MAWLGVGGYESAEKIRLESGISKIHLQRMAWLGVGGYESKEKIRLESGISELQQQ